MFTKREFTLLGTSLLLALAGCGGGSGGDDVSSLTYDGPTAAIVISSEEEADAVASEVVSLESTSTVLSDATDITIPLGIAATATDSGSSPFQLKSLGEMAKKYTALALKSEATAVDRLAGITESESQVCSGGGTVTVTVTYSDPAQLTAGDTFSLSFNNCIEGSEKTHGALTLSLDSFTLNPDETLGDFAASYTFANLISTNTATGDYVWLNGAFSAGFSGDAISTALVITLSGNSLVMSERSGGVTEQARLTNFSFTDTLATNGDFSFDHDYTYASTSIGGSITVTTETPFIVYYGDSYPTVGQVVVSGAAGASIRLTAIDNLTALIEYDLGGDGLYGNETIDPASKMVNWADF
ncbi:MAG: hypothetical protein OQL08_12255 [Gammaproteobacteria bacterium]|nr:hypothetical protein [Gammaproteobacteria bacterium]